MPNYSLQINSHFKPFSFERYIQPLQIYGQAYKEQEEALNSLQMQANTVEAMIDRARDTEAAKRYDAYMEGLNAQAEALSTSGLLPGVRNSVNTLRGDYFNRIVPIQKAYETMMKQIEEQRKTGDTKINEYNAGDLSIDDFLNNPEKTYRTIDRQNLYVKSAAEFGALQNDLTSYSLEKDPKIKDNFQKAFIKKYGARPEDVSQFMSEVQTAIEKGVPMNRIVASNSTMANIFNNLFKGSGVGTWGNRNAEIDVANTILSGATNAIGKSDINLVTDQAEVFQAQLNQAKEIARIKAGAKDGTELPEKLWQPRTFATKKDRDVSIKDWRENMDLFTRDNSGNWKIKEDMLSIPINIGTAGGARVTLNPRNSFLGTYGLLDKNGAIIKDQSKINDIVNKYNNLINDDYDALGYSEYFRTIAPSDYSSVFDMLSRRADKHVLNTIEYATEKDGIPQMAPSNTPLNIKDKKSSDITGARFVESSTGDIYIEVEFAGDENHYAIPIPENVAKQARNKMMEVRDLSNMLNDEDLIKNMTTEDLYNIQRDIATYGNESFDILSRFIGTSKTKPIEVKQDESDFDDLLSILTRS